MHIWTIWCCRFHLSHFGVKEPCVLWTPLTNETRNFVPKLFGFFLQCCSKVEKWWEKKISLSLKKDSSELAMILVYYDYNPKSSTTTQRLASGPSFGEKEAKLLLLLRIGKEALELPSPSQLLQFLSNYWLRFASTLTIIYRSLFP